VYLQLVSAILLSLVLILIALQNPNPLQIIFLKWETGPVPLIVIIIISFLVGVILTVLFNLNRQRKLKLIISQQAGEIEKMSRTPKLSDKKLLKALEDDDF